MNKQTLYYSLAAVLALLVLAALAGCTGTASGGSSAPAATTALSTTAAVPAPGQAGITITQSDGTDVTLPAIPGRIIATNTDVAEMLIAIGAADTIVGVTETTKNTSYIMEKIPQAQSIGNWQTPNVEQMLALHPDVVISYASSKPKNLDQITAANITVIYLDCYRAPKLAQDARALGTLTGHTAAAEAYARMVENVTSTILDRVAPLPQSSLPPVYFEGYTDFTAAGPGSGSDELLTMAGGKNIVGNMSSSSPKVSAEYVVAMKPAYVMKAVSVKETRPWADVAANMSARTGWETIPAVQEKHIYLYSSGIGYGPKAYIGLASMAKILHPDLFADLDPQAMLDYYAGRYVSGTNATTQVWPSMG